METITNQVIPPETPQPRTEIKKSDIIKIILFIILALFFAWVFVQAGMRFNPSYFRIEIG